MELTKRKQKILSSVVSGFITKGEPVGSKSIADEIGVSSATVRNEMADLIELGLLTQPYTSAGRIPSQKGLRVFIDTIATFDEMSEQDKGYISSYLAASSYDPEKLLKCVSKLLPIYTKYASVVSTPSGGASRVRAVQFVQISRRSAMLILMSSSGTIKNRVFHCNYDLSSEILRMFFKLFNEKLRDVNISNITIPYIQTLGSSFGEMSILAGPALVALLEAADETKVSEIIVSGQMNMIYYPELSYDDVRSLVSFLDKKEETTELLKQKPNKTTVLIGDESGMPELRNCTVVISRYNIDSIDAGGFAVVGPIRMDYEKVISAMIYISCEISEILTSLMEES